MESIDLMSMGVIELREQPSIDTLQNRQNYQYKLNISFAAITITANFITMFYLMIQPTRKTTYKSMYFCLLLTTIAWGGVLLAGGSSISSRNNQQLGSEFTGIFNKSSTID